MTIFANKSTVKHRLFWLSLAFLLRLYFVIKPGHNLDLSTFASWGYQLNHLPGYLFFHRVWSDYLPLPLLFTKLIAWLASYLSLPFTFIWKLSLVILETGLLWLISYFSPFNRFSISLILLYFCPALIINGALWGQVDALVSLLLLLAFLLARVNSFWPAMFSFVLAFSFKSLVILTLPLFIFRFGFSFLFPFVGFVFLPSLYFLVKPNPLSLIKFFLHRLFFQTTVYPFTTINAFNFWSLLSHFWASDTFSVLGLTARSFGLFLVGLFYFGFWFRAWLHRSNFSLLIRASILSLLAYYFFGTRMHERHLLYALPSLLIIYSPSSYLVFILFTLVFSLNNLASLFWLNHHQTWPFPPLFNRLISLLALFGFFVLFLDFFKFKLRSWFKFILSRKWLFFLFLLAFGLRLYRLNYPRTMIFDEVYHAFTARQFVRGDNLVAWEWWHSAPKGYAYEWTHPPLAKYGMVLGMLLFGQNSFGWRFGSALFGSLSIILVYLLAKSWFRSSKIAFLAAILVSFDGLHLAQSRIAMNDIYMLFFSLLSLLLASRRRWSLASLSLGLSLASKWSAVYLGLPLSYVFFQQHKFSLSTIIKAGRYVLIVILTYILSYAPFFLHHSWSQFYELQYQMWFYHTHLKATHPYQSKPWQWVLGLRPVWYYTHQFSSRLVNIYNQSNPPLLSLAFLSLPFLFLFWKQILIVPLLAYFSFILPWLFSPRIMFFYHYLPSLTFLYILLAYLLAKLPKTALIFFLLFCLFGFLIFLVPSIYGFPLPSWYWHSLFKLFPSWQ